MDGDSGDQGRSASGTASRQGQALSFRVIFTLSFLLLATALAGVGRAQSELGEQLARVDHIPDSTGDSLLKGLAWTDGRCEGCHEPDSLFSHPVGVVPSMSVPGNLPLEKGRLTCATCHDNSQSTLHFQARSQHTSLLRAGGTGTAFCGQCHKAGKTDRRTQHALGLGTAHLRWKDGSSDLPNQTRGEVDSESRQCLSCHDGSSAKYVAIAPNTVDLDPRSQSHPIGGKTRDRWGRRTAMAPSKPVDDRVRLYDGQLGCGSCHSLFSDQQKLLVMANPAGELCTSCHPR